MKDNKDPAMPRDEGSTAVRTGMTRRETLRSGAVIAAAPVLMAQAGEAQLQREAFPKSAESDRCFALKSVINGEVVEQEIDVRTSLLDFLRETVALTGAKKGCDHGQCGACTVHLDGRRILSCLTLAVKAHGRQILTIEGLEKEGRLHPMQQAFIDHDALQCGYCTPGQIMSAIACIDEGNATTHASIREYMSGNICRCGAYPGIVAAIQNAAQKMEKL